MTPKRSSRPLDEILSKRERQVMDVIYRRGEATAAEVYEELPDAPSYNAVRAALRLLEEKGHLRHERDRRRYVYRPTVAPERAGRSALLHLVGTFFEGSTDRVVNTLFEERRPSESELRRLERLIEAARTERSGAAERSSGEPDRSTQEPDGSKQEPESGRD